MAFLRTRLAKEVKEVGPLILYYKPIIGFCFFGDQGKTITALGGGGGCFVLVDK